MSLEQLRLSHLLHSLGTTVLGLAARDEEAARAALSGMRRALSPARRAELAALGRPRR